MFRMCISISFPRGLPTLQHNQLHQKNTTFKTFTDLKGSETIDSFC